MVKPPVGGFKMDTSSKRPFLGKNFLLFLAGFSLFTGISNTFEPSDWAQVELLNNPEAISQQLEGGLVIFQDNTLLPLSNPSNPGNEIKGKIFVLVTAYSSTPWETDGNPFITASGTWVRDGVVANNKLPLGTKVRFPDLYGEKIFVVEDRMHSRKGSYQFDIWLPSYWEAKDFGVRKTYIEILEG